MTKWTPALFRRCANSSQRESPLPVTAEGKPFFYPGRTPAWELFHRLTREQAEHYLEDRRANGSP